MFITSAERSKGKFLPGKKLTMTEEVQFYSKKHGFPSPSFYKVKEEITTAKKGILTK